LLGAHCKEREADRLPLFLGYWIPEMEFRPSPGVWRAGQTDLYKSQQFSVTIKLSQFSEKKSKPFKKGLLLSEMDFFAKPND
jgi:hypothetical protein